MKALRYTYLLVGLLYSLSGLYSQGLIADFSFDDCTVTDQTGNYTDNAIRNSIACDCGVGDNSNALYFDGSADTVFLDDGLKDIFLRDFSMSFYFWVDDAPQEYPLFSIRSECTKDSSFLIRYSPFQNELEVTFSLNVSDETKFEYVVDPDKCWQHFLLTRAGNLFTLYIDGRFIESFEELTPLGLGENHDVTIGYSPCATFEGMGPDDVFFHGRIDELKFYDYAIIEETEISALNLSPDRIITNDTTVFLGDAIQIRTGETCAPNIIWTPTAGLDDPSIKEPMASPDVTTTYQVQFDYGICQSLDELIVSVVDQNAIACADLLLPTAFTPNNDNLNDRYGISNTFIIESLSRYEIYDRWGNKIFDSTDKDGKWDGLYKGQKMPIGTYVYKIEYTCQGSIYQKTGSFNILK